MLSPSRSLGGHRDDSWGCIHPDMFEMHAHLRYSHTYIPGEGGVLLHNGQSATAAQRSLTGKMSPQVLLPLNPRWEISSPAMIFRHHPPTNLWPFLAPRIVCSMPLSRDIYENDQGASLPSHTGSLNLYLFASGITY